MKQNETIEEKITYLRSMIDEMREDGCHNVAGLVCSRIGNNVGNGKVR